MRSPAFALALALAGCASTLPREVALLGETATLQSGCHVGFRAARLSAHAVEVQVDLQNLSGDRMSLDQGGFALRLPDGRVLTGTDLGGWPLPLAPGERRPMRVAFQDPEADLRALAGVDSPPGARGVALVVGGVSFDSDPRPRVVGELPLVALSEPSD